MKRTKRSLLIPEYGDVTDASVRAKYGYLEAIVSIIGNIILFLLKLVLGLLINSIALIADGVHSLSDVATSAVVILGFRMAKKPADEKHPFGHGRIEYIASLIIAVLLLFVGVEFIREAVSRFGSLHGFSNQQLAIPIAAIVLFSALLKELMARYSITLSKKIKSDVLTADGWHHRSDAFSSIGVAISIIGSSYGFYILDPVFGIVVAAIIMYVGVGLVRSTADSLIGQRPEDYIFEQIEQIANEAKGIYGVHNISFHDYGNHKIVTLHAEVDSNLSLDQAHKLADDLELEIRTKTKYGTVIHLEPVSEVSKCPMKREVITCLLRFKKEVIAFHKVQIIQVGSQVNVKLRATVDPTMSVEQSHELYEKIKHCIQESNPDYLVDIHFDPAFKK